MSPESLVIISRRARLNERLANVLITNMPVNDVFDLVLEKRYHNFVVIEQPHIVEQLIIHYKELTAEHLQQLRTLVFQWQNVNILGHFSANVLDVIL